MNLLLWLFGIKHLTYSFRRLLGVVPSMTKQFLNCFLAFLAGADAVAFLIFSDSGVPAYRGI